MAVVVLVTAGWSAPWATVRSVGQVPGGSSPPWGTCSTDRRPRSTATPPPGTATGEGLSTAAPGTCPMWTPDLHTHPGKCSFILNPKLTVQFCHLKLFCSIFNRWTGKFCNCQCGYIENRIAQNCLVFNVERHNATYANGFNYLILFSG